MSCKQYTLHQLECGEVGHFQMSNGSNEIY